MDRQNEQYAYFTIVDSFDPKEITRLVNIEPTDSWQKGELNSLTQQKRKFSRWSLYSRLDKSADLEAHIRDVLDQLETNITAFQNVSIKYEGCLQLVGYFHQGYPGLHFDHEIIERIAKLYLSVDCDFYYYDRKEPEFDK